MQKDIMDILINEAKKTVKDIPVAAAVVKDGKIISLCVNEREKTNKVVSHAEILALNKANEILSDWKLCDCEMYVTLEPCPMCAWAIINARIKKLYFGSSDTKYGAFGGAINLKTLANSKIEVIAGLKEEKCDNLLKDYFRKLRNEKTAG